MDVVCEPRSSERITWQRVATLPGGYDHRKPVNPLAPDVLFIAQPAPAKTVAPARWWDAEDALLSAC